MAPIAFRRATEADLPAIVALLADDPLAGPREDPSPPLAAGYLAAFAAIDADEKQLLAVAVDGGQVIGTLQLTFIAGISRKGALRGLIEAVRIAKDRRSTGLGQQMVEWAVAECRRRGCALVQLTSDNHRPDAHRFWARMGFEASHVGFKLGLE
jgi:GNAT superfamily N-acetyltransferase